MRKPTELAKFSSVRQGEAKGLGHAVLCAKEVIGDEPFAVLLGDDLVDGKVRGFASSPTSTNARARAWSLCYEVPAGQEHLYGIVDGTRTGPRELALKQLIEKPAPGTAPSRLAIIGRYVLPPEIFGILEKTTPGAGGRFS